jgi:xanthine dehydrogenase accessory factor
MEYVAPGDGGHSGGQSADRKVSIFQALAQLEEKNEAGVLCTIIRSDGSTPRHEASKMLVYPNGSILGTVGGGELEARVIAAALEALQDGEARILTYSMSEPQRGDPGVCGGQLEIFLDPVRQKPALVVIGAGHVGKAVAHLARWLGFRVVVNDDRPDFCSPQAFPEADEHLVMPISDLPAHMKITPWTYFVLTTRNVMVDVEGLPALLDTPAAYVGVIGSKRRWATTRQHLLEAGIPQEKLARVYSPMGLELNAETPEEIAVSILAEIIMLRNKGDGKPMGE